MTLKEYYLVYPDGDSQQIQGPLKLNEVVDMNGNPLSIGWPPPQVIAYRIYRQSTREEIGFVKQFYYAELMDMNQLRSFARHGS